MLKKSFQLIVFCGLPFGTPQAAIDLAKTCEGKAEGADCWLELANKPGCHIWNNHLNADEAANWTGQCKGGLRTAKAWPLGHG